MTSEVCLIVIFRLSKILLCCTANPQTQICVHELRPDMRSDCASTHVQTDKCRSLRGNVRLHDFLLYVHLINEGQYEGTQWAQTSTKANSLLLYHANVQVQPPYVSGIIFQMNGNYVKLWLLNWTLITSAKFSNTFLWWSWLQTVHSQMWVGA